MNTTVGSGVKERVWVLLLYQMEDISDGSGRHAGLPLQKIIKSADIVMLNHPALEHKNGIFRDIGGKVGDALKVFRDPQNIDAAADNGRMLGHIRYELPQNLIAQIIDNAVAAADLNGKLRVFIDERIKHIGKHAPDQLAHVRYVNEGLDRRHPYEF